MEASEIANTHERVIYSIKRVISLIDEEIASIEKEIDLTIRSDPIEVVAIQIKTKNRCREVYNFS
ncbi:hypothetical protein VCRA2116O29_560025 [Vibrio crassostreae]|nr:hypothetical protein VCRA2116O29_560025 [Vibrio crassostreae]CAK3860355.1 hypothetical protein VCRA2123O74_530025 [Vibrio crassostreae]